MLFLLRSRYDVAHVCDRGNGMCTCIYMVMSTCHDTATVMIMVTVWIRCVRIGVTVNVTVTMVVTGMCICMIMITVMVRFKVMHTIMATMLVTDMRMGV